WTAIVGVSRADYATIANHGGAVVAAIVSRRVTTTIVATVVGRGVAAAVIPGAITVIVSVAGTVGICVRRQPADHRPRNKPACDGREESAAPAPVSGFRGRRRRYRRQAQDCRSSQNQRCFPHGLLLSVRPMPDSLHSSEVPLSQKQTSPKHFRVNFVA